MSWFPAARPTGRDRGVPTVAWTGNVEAPLVAAWRGPVSGRDGRSDRSECDCGSAGDLANFDDADSPGCNRVGGSREYRGGACCRPGERSVSRDVADEVENGGCGGSGFVRRWSGSRGDGVSGAGRQGTSDRKSPTHCVCQRDEAGRGREKGCQDGILPNARSLRRPGESRLCARNVSYSLRWRSISASYSA
jgi:hypothetical protein